MEKFLEKALDYVERVVSPYQIWLIILVISGALVFLPNEFLEKLSLQVIVSSYRGYLVIALSIAVLIIALKSVAGISSLIGSIERVDSYNLNDEERAVLCFFIKNQFQGASLNEKHPTVVSLKNRKFIEIPHSPIFFIGGDHFEYFVLTKSAKRKLSSNKFQNKIFEDLNENRILDFINSISREQFSIHSPQTLR